MTENWTKQKTERLTIAANLRRAAAYLERDGVHDLRIDEVKNVLIGALNDIDRARDYGNPGAGIDQMLGKEMAHG